MQDLSLTKQTFDALRVYNLIYVDKTDQIQTLFLQPKGGAYFLARPRRFGKSLLVDTLDCIFSGRKELFNDLAISKTDYAWPVHPVVRLDFAEMGKTTPEVLKTSFAQVLYEQGKKYSLEININDNIGSMGRELIRGLHAKYQKGIVLLVDEYDKPILDCIEQEEIANKMRSVMKEFFDIVKPLGSAIHLTFITGVGRFSLAGFSSGLNHMDDLTTDARAATLLGYTQQEVEHYFADYLAQHAAAFPGALPALLEEIKKWYNGYRFSRIDQRVYNPFSLMKFMQTGNFANYWFTTGTPSFLVKLMAKSNYWHDRFTRTTEIIPEQLVIHELHNLDPHALLFQAGYLTIKEVVSGLARRRSDSFALAYPNIEIEESMHACLLMAMTGVSNSDATHILRRLSDALYTANVDDFLQAMKINFAKIPYQIHPTEHTMLETKEHYYHSVFFTISQLLGFNVQAEFSTNLGRADVIVSTETHLFIFELKLDAPAEVALAQIKNRDYAHSFIGQGKSIVLVGVAFSSTTRNIAEWVIESLTPTQA